MAKDKKKKKNKKEGVDLFERYKLLVNARNFHYENFNKWLTYFYVANAAIFVGYMQSLSAKVDVIFSIAILVIGFVSGLLLYWSSKGYYYWNINFIMLVNYYEEKLLGWNEDERIYSMFANKNEQNNYLNPTKGANFSTSKIAILFSFIISISWGIALFYSILSQSSTFNIFLNEWHIIVTSVLISLGVITLLGSLKKFNKKEKKKKEKKPHFLWSNTDPLHDLRLEQ